MVFSSLFSYQKSYMQLSPLLRAILPALPGALKKGESQLIACHEGTGGYIYKFTLSFTSAIYEGEW